MQILKKKQQKNPTVFGLKISYLITIFKSTIWQNMAPKTQSMV